MKDEERERETDGNTAELRQHRQLRRVVDFHKCLGHDPRGLKVHVNAKIRMASVH